MKATNKDMKSANKHAIATYIYSKKSATKQDIAYDLGISLPTVFQNIKELEQEGIIAQVGQLQSTGGRKATEFSIVAEHRYAIGIDLTHQYLTLVLLNLQGELVDTQRIPFHFSIQQEAFQAIAHQVEEIRERNSIAQARILGVGISIAGIVDVKNKLLYQSHVFDIARFDLQVFATYLPYPLYFHNDANSAAFAQKVHTHANTFVYIALNPSIGGAIYYHGELLYGDSFKAGEIGHMTLIPNGTACYCGKNGCLDAYCSENVLLAHAPSLAEFFTMLEEQHPDIVQVWNDYLDHLAIAIHNLRMIFDCDIILGGSIRKYLDPYMMQLSEKINHHNPFEQLTSYLKLSYYHQEASAIGVALHHINAFFEGS